MGKYDMCMKAYLQDKRRFADLFNGSCFQGRQLFRAMNCRKNKEKMAELMKNEAYAHLSKETWEAIAVMTDNAAMLQKKDKYKTENGEEEEYNMCQALEELMEDNRREGRREGRNEGTLEKTKIVVRNLLRMGFSVDDICKAAECAPALVEEMQQCFRRGEKESKY